MKIQEYSENDYVAKWEEVYKGLTIKFVVTQEYRRSLDKVLLTITEGLDIARQYGGRVLLEYLCQTVDCGKMMQWGKVNEVCTAFPCIYFKISFPQKSKYNCQRFYELIRQNDEEFLLKVFDSVECFKDYAERVEEKRRVNLAT